MDGTGERNHMLRRTDSQGFTGISGNLFSYTYFLMGAVPSAVQTRTTGLGLATFPRPRPPCILRLGHPTERTGLPSSRRSVAAAQRPGVGCDTRLAIPIAAPTPGAGFPSAGHRRTPRKGLAIRCQL